MSSTVSRWISNLLIWVGLVIIVIGGALMYPFVRDIIEAQSDPSTTLSFVVTLPPAPTLLAITPVIPAPTPTFDVASAALTPTSTSTPQPVATASSLPAPTSPTRSAPTPTATSTTVPTPVVLPDNGTSPERVTTAPAADQPTPVATGNPPDRIVVPAIGLDVPVVTVGWHVEQIKGAAVSVWDVPDRRVAGWLKTSAPAGQPGNTVLDGHHNIKGEVFRRLVDLKPSDVIDLYANGAVYHYAVTEKHILPDRDQPMQVRIANAQWIQPTDDERLTLVTCWPYTNNTHRLIIVARPLPSLPSDRK
jgi:sortase A